MSARPVLFTLLALLLAIAAVVPAQAQQQKGGEKPAALVSVDAVIREEARQTVPVLGRLVARNSGEVSALVKGVVAQLPVQVGDRVARGNVLAVLSPNSLKWARELRAAEVKSAQAELANARAQTALRQQELKRLENLKKSAAFSAARFEDAKQELAKAKSDAAKAEADIASARASLELAEIDLANAEVKAPYAGVVANVHTAVGTYLNTGQPVVTMVDDHNLEIEADVPANRVQGLLPGQVVTFALGVGDEKFAAVRAVVPEENPLTRTRKVRFTPPQGALAENAAANQSVSLAIPAGRVRDVVTVHKDAVLNKGGRRVVFLVEDGKANLRPVQLGEAVGGRFVVLSGLMPGDRVVVRGNERLRPGQIVKIGKN